MTSKTATDQATPRNLRREDWLATARKVLVASGIDDVKVDRLATKLRVTRGSFYWHFKDRKDLLDALLSDWEGRNYFELAQIRTRWSRNDPDLSEVVIIWLGEDPSFPAFDMAVRVWARKDPPVADSVSRVDDGWISLLTEVFLKGGYDPTESLVRARVAYFHQIGYYALGMKEELSERIRLTPYYYKALTGHEAPSDFLDRIAAIEGPAESRKRRAIRKGK